MGQNLIEKCQLVLFKKIYYRMISDENKLDKL